jgi:hypothetical protein
VAVIIASGYAQLPKGADKDVKTLQKPFSQRQLNDVLLSVQSRKPHCEWEERRMPPFSLWLVATQARRVVFAKRAASFVFDAPSLRSSRTSF